MRFKKLLLLGVAVLAATALIYLYAPSMSQDVTLVNADDTKAVTTAADTATGASITNNVSEVQPEDPAVDLTYDTQSFKGASLPERLTAMSTRRNGRAFDPAQVADALKSDIAWEADPAIAAKLPLTEEERKDGREFVRVNPIKIEALVAGDEISLPIQQIKSDIPMRMVVDEVEQGIGGNVTWRGHLKNFSTENQVTFTRGDGSGNDTLIVGGVSTPDKNYVVQIHGGIGWIVDGFTIFKGKHDAIKPDRH